MLGLDYDFDSDYSTVRESCGVDQWLSITFSIRLLGQGIDRSNLHPTLFHPHRTTRIFRSLSMKGPNLVGDEDATCNHVPGAMVDDRSRRFRMDGNEHLGRRQQYQDYCPANPSAMLQKKTSGDMWIWAAVGEVGERELSRDCRM